MIFLQWRYERWIFDICSALLVLYVHVLLLPGDERNCFRMQQWWGFSLKNVVIARPFNVEVCGYAHLSRISWAYTACFILLLSVIGVVGEHWSFWVSLLEDPGWDLIWRFKSLACSFMNTVFGLLGALITFAWPLHKVLEIQSFGEGFRGKTGLVVLTKQIQTGVWQPWLAEILVG